MASTSLRSQTQATDSTRSGCNPKIAARTKLRPVAPEGHEHPQAIVPSQRAEWWVLAGLDGALVSSADGTGTAWYKRDPQRFRSLL